MKSFFSCTKGCGVYLFSFLFILMAIQANATWVKGTVKDVEGNLLSFAAVYVEDTKKGTTANEDGQYALEVPEGNTTIVVKYLGYKTASKTVFVSGKSIQLDFVLDFEELYLDDVVVKANREDPAYGIMRQVIAHKEKNAQKVNTLETDIYLKGKLYIKSLPNQILGVQIDDSSKQAIQKQLNLDSNSAGTVYLLEQMTHYYYKAPNKSLNKVMAIKTSGDPRGLGFSTMPPIVDVYSNNMEVLEGVNPRGFISPAHNNAFQYYKFKFEGSYEEDGHLINKISFWPKRSKEPTFRGTLYVVDDVWAFKQLELILDRNAQVDVVDTLILRQQYYKAKNNSWVIEQQVLYPVIKLFGITIAGDFLTSYSNTKINAGIADSVFRPRIISVYDSAALKADSAFWNRHRPVVLSDEEVSTYKFQDSVYIQRQSVQDSLYHTPSKHFGFNDFLSTGAYYKLRNNKYGIAALMNTIGYNTVEGLVIGLSPYWHHDLGKGDSINISWQNHYGFANKKWQSLLSISFMNMDSTFIGKKATLWANIGRHVPQINNHQPIDPIMNTYTTLIDGLNLMKIYQSTQAQIGYDYHLGNGLRIMADVKAEQREEMINHSNYSFLKPSKRKFTANQPRELPDFEDHNAFIINVGLEYQPGWKYVEYPEYKMAVGNTAPIFKLGYTKGIPQILNSKTDFDQWNFGIEHTINMKLIGQLKYNAQAGGFLNDKYVGLPDRWYIYGNRLTIANPYLKSFQTAPYYAYSHTAPYYGQLHAEWHLNGFISNKLPLLKQLDWHFVLSGNGFYQEDGSHYTEYGLGLEHIGFKLFKFVRLDYFIGRGSEHDKWRNGFRLGLTLPMGMVSIQ